MRQLILALILVTAGLAAAHADESDFLIIGGVDFGFKRLKLDVNGARSSFSPSYVSVNPTIVLSYKSFYAGVAYDKALSAGSGSDDVQGPTGPVASTLDFSRADSTLTAGYRLNPSLSVFVGFANGTSTFTQTTFDTTITVIRTTYAETGPFVGVAYTSAFGDKGSLGLSVAYARLNGELHTITRPGSILFDANGNASGLSYGVTWSGSLTGSLGYHVGVKATRYTMHDPIGITERYTNIFVGVSNYF
jgi:hypothetical protein